VDDVDAATERRIMDEIVVPTVRALAREGTPDPECQALMVRAGVDIVPLLLAAARGEAVPAVPEWGTQAAVCVSVASGGYPGNYRTGIRIEGLQDAESVEGVQVFHAGTAEREGALVTAGGRVLAVTAAAADLGTAIARAYEAIGRIHVDGMHFRRDIGRGLLRRPR
jgi:phosphoribosylamine--glycine ligase